MEIALIPYTACFANSVCVPSYVFHQAGQIPSSPVVREGVVTVVNLSRISYGNQMWHVIRCQTVRTSHIFELASPIHVSSFFCYIVVGGARSLK